MFENADEIMVYEHFNKLSDDTIANLMRENGSTVCVIPVNGTRRWFLLERGEGDEGEYAEAYLQKVTPRHYALYKLFLDHGMDTLILPILGYDVMARGEEYAAMAIHGLKRMTEDPVWKTFCKENNTRVRFYGEYRHALEKTTHAHLLDSIEALTCETAQYGPKRIFFGLFAADPTEQIARLAADYVRQAGRYPGRRELVSLYYGEYIDYAALFIGFDKCSVYDMPLLSSGNEDLYFVVAPSLYLTSRTLREILYDHLYLRRVSEPEYSDLSADAVQHMRDYYLQNKEQVLGLGDLKDGIWYPRMCLTDK